MEETTRPAHPSRQPGSAVSRNQGAAESDPTFYWELDLPEREVSYLAASAEEGYLANDLIRGTQLLRTPAVYEECPKTVDIIDADTCPEVYTDAIAAILQLCAWNGFDPYEIAERGLHGQASIYDDSCEAARNRRE